MLRLDAAFPWSHRPTCTMVHACASGETWRMRVTAVAVLVNKTQESLSRSKSSAWWRRSDICRSGGISADELHELTVDPEEDGGPVDTLQLLPQPNLSAWSTSSCGLSVSAPNKLNLISKSFPLIPPEWTLNGASIIYTDPSVSSRACCSGAALQLLRQRLDAWLRRQNWEERTSFDGGRAREKERNEGSNCLNLTREKQRRIKETEREVSQGCFLMNHSWGVRRHKTNKWNYHNQETRFTQPTSACRPLYYFT